MVPRTACSASGRCTCPKGSVERDGDCVLQTTAGANGSDSIESTASSTGVTSAETSAEYAPVTPDGVSATTDFGWEGSSEVSSSHIAITTVQGNAKPGNGSRSDGATTAVTSTTTVPPARGPLPLEVNTTQSGTTVDHAAEAGQGTNSMVSAETVSDGEAQMKPVGGTSTADNADTTDLLGSASDELASETNTVTSSISSTTLPSGSSISYHSDMTEVIPPATSATSGSAAAGPSGYPPYGDSTDSTSGSTEMTETKASISEFTTLDATTTTSMVTASDPQQGSLTTTYQQGTDYQQITLSSTTGTGNSGIGQGLTTTTMTTTKTTTTNGAVTPLSTTVKSSSGMTHSQQASTETSFETTANHQAHQENSFHTTRSTSRAYTEGTYRTSIASSHQPNPRYTSKKPEPA